MFDDKKIIVDEDWKSRVEAEREQERLHAEAPGTKPAATGEPDATGELPPPSFSLLVTTLATEAMIGLGQLPHPVTQQFHPDAQQARYAIDMLEVLADKTKGNLTPTEEHFLVDILHQLRMAFVAVSAPSAGTLPPG